MVFVAATYALPLRADALPRDEYDCEGKPHGAACGQGTCRISTCERRNYPRSPDASPWTFYPCTKCVGGTDFGPPSVELTVDGLAPNYVLFTRDSLSGGGLFFISTVFERGRLLIWAAAPRLPSLYLMEKRAFDAWRAVHPPAPIKRSPDVDKLQSRDVDKLIASAAVACDLRSADDLAPRDPVNDPEWLLGGTVRLHYEADDSIGPESGQSLNPDATPRAAIGPDGGAWFDPDASLHRSIDATLVMDADGAVAREPPTPEPGTISLAGGLLTVGFDLRYAGGAPYPMSVLLFSDGWACPRASYFTEGKDEVSHRAAHPNDWKHWRDHRVA